MFCVYILTFRKLYSKKLNYTIFLLKYTWKFIFSCIFCIEWFYWFQCFYAFLSICLNIVCIFGHIFILQLMESVYLHNYIYTSREDMSKSINFMVLIVLIWTKDVINSVVFRLHLKGLFIMKKKQHAYHCSMKKIP